MDEKDKPLFDLYWDMLTLGGKAFREKNPGLYPDKPVSTTLSHGAWVQATRARLPAAKDCLHPVDQAKFEIRPEKGRTLIGWIDIVPGHREDDPPFLLRLRMTAADNDGDESLLAAYNRTYFEVRYRATAEERKLPPLHVAFDTQGNLASGLTPVELPGEYLAYTYDVRATKQHTAAANADSVDESSWRERQLLAS